MQLGGLGEGDTSPGAPSWDFGAVLSTCLPPATVLEPAEKAARNSSSVTLAPRRALPLPQRASSQMLAPPASSKVSWGPGTKKKARAWPPDAQGKRRGSPRAHGSRRRWSALQWPVYKSHPHSLVKVAAATRKRSAHHVATTAGCSLGSLGSWGGVGWG